MNAICCNNVNCDDSSHGASLCCMYNHIVEALLEASKSLVTQSRKSKNISPGWNKYVASHHAEANKAHRAWVMAGRPRQGPELDFKKKMNAKYKYALRYISKQERALSSNSMADTLLHNDVNSFWKEVKTLNMARAALPCNIEGVTDAVDIADLWRQHYATLFNCIKS